MKRKRQYLGSPAGQSGVVGSKEDASRAPTVATTFILDFFLPPSPQPHPLCTIARQFLAQGAATYGIVSCFPALAHSLKTDNVVGCLREPGLYVCALPDKKLLKLDDDART